MSKKTLIIIAIVVGCVILIPIVVVVVTVALIGNQINTAATNLPVHEAETRSFLSKEVPRLDTPASCSITSKTYTKGDLDTVSAWNVSYACNTTGGAAYDSILANLKSQGFSVVSDNSLPVQLTGDEKQQVLYYDFHYDTKSYGVSYSFYANANAADTTGRFYHATDALRASPVKDIELSLTRAN